MEKQGTGRQFVIDSPVGKLAIRHNERALCGIDFVSASTRLIQPATPLAKKVNQQLQRYFRNAAIRFDIPMETSGTPFQMRVWSALKKIPSGKTMTYGQLAKKLHTSPRAVGNACRANPISVIVPCHRVIAADGLGGFSGARRGKKLARKSWLLEHEKSA